MVLGDLGDRWVVMRDNRAYLTSVSSIWVRLGDLRGRWVVMLALRVYLAVFGWFQEVLGVAGR